ncbi:hypothetical protein VRRI112168_10025 [Vreelandella rituensis]|uniref:Zinc resistance-associated protein n=1 Tax=Vreelandella rituensis TaxID=2282306 RepID=A0A368U6Y2_9GAMM|nr:hypothetical protein [Halomonas rituensis]RCV90813.1 hypothetical protein DU506_10890 [Halomonas rituensis]
MTAQRISKFLAPALFALAIAPFTLTAQAGQDDDKAERGHGRMQLHEEHRQALHERAGFDEETRAELASAHEEYLAARRELRDQHRERMDEILDEDEQQALHDAMQEMRTEMREKARDNHGNRGERNSD